MKIYIKTEITKVYEGHIAKDDHMWLIVTYKEVGFLFVFNTFTCIYAKTVPVSDLTPEKTSVIFDEMLREVKRKRAH